MSKPKYMKGDCIRSLDDLVLQENIFWNGRIWNRKWFMNLQIQLLLSLIKHKALQYAVRLDGITTGVFVEPVLWHKLNERPLTDAEKSEFSEHGYLDSAGGRRQGMSKAVLISIRPMWYQKIMSGQKTIEVRKTRPKMNPPFKCYIYKCGNGKVIGEFLCDQIININGAGRIPSDAARPTCLEPAELHQYLGAATGFGWHISNLRIYDTPRELREFYAVPNEVEVALKAKPKPITRPPQSWRYVEEELWSD